MITVSLSEDLDAGLVPNAVDQRLQRRLAAEGRFDQMHQLNPEMKHVDTLGRDQAQVKRQLQPAAGKDQGRGARRGFGRGVGRHFSKVSNNVRACL
jgi:hypothetical protein